jgi:hypothetical protein
MISATASTAAGVSSHIHARFRSLLIPASAFSDGRSGASFNGGAEYFVRGSFRTRMKRAQG